ncbi:hypothetical protein GQ43DRAFT_468853 [Delitschia confertaspora ATCC 74209]|uniref:Uncharacterized protein n=1 Tax=Delitschia confertaspora ATCC 74209 TaxID=1513339 RepID=A0A9P4MT06_9PLEO|nr:hypothetical protein GQ43DRAFT_468853 [Delitschia confertaspora ATCC 74209]
MKTFNGIMLDKEEGSVIIGSGSHLGEVYAELRKKGLEVTGRGRARWAWEGGLSYLPEIHGFVADEVANFEVILAFHYVV